MKTNFYQNTKPDGTPGEHLIKMFFFHYNLMLMVILFIHTLIFYFEGNENIVVFFFATVLLLGLVTTVNYRLEYQILKYFLDYYLVAKITLLFVLLFMFWKIAPETILFFALLPLGLYNLYSFKTVLLLTSLITLLLVIMVNLPLSYFPDIIVNKNAHLSKVKVLLTFLPISLFLIFYNIKIFEKKHQYKDSKAAPENEDTASEKSKAKEGDEENLQMYTEIYHRIKEYLESETPWKNPEFGIQDLAYEFGINTTYLSKAISQNSDTNFKNLINTYRINYIKDEMKVNYPKYTLMHIYISAGFKHQSTFNRAFKQIENKTPSEYMRSIGIDAYAISE